MSDVILKLENLHVSYGSIKALKGISIEVKQGQIVALLGANGAGKTTTLKSLSGMVPAQSGKISLFQKEIINPEISYSNESDRKKVSVKRILRKLKFLLFEKKSSNLSPEKITNLGMIQSPEGRQIFSDITVEENLRVGAFTVKNRKEIEANFERVYKYFPILMERKKQMAGTLSGGEQQMLAIGRALMANPKVLLLDEPSLGLAPLIVASIFEILKEINAAGTTVLLIEQNALQTLKIADYAYVLEVGEMAMEGKASDLIQDKRLIEAYLGG